MGPYIRGVANRGQCLVYATVTCFGSSRRLSYTLKLHCNIVYILISLYQP
jgi:hypothetical protein